MERCTDQVFEAQCTGNIDNMNATNTAFFIKLIESLKPLQGLNTSWFTKPEIWLSLFASFVALFLGGGGGRYIKPFLKIKPDLRVADLRRFRQAPHVWRLAIKNIGTETAQDVQVDITKLIQNDSPRENFLTMPLRWTHVDSETRNILPKQTVYLDLIEHHTTKSSPTVNIASRFGSGVDDFRELDEGKTKLELTFYYQNGDFTFTKETEINWKGIFLDCRIKGQKWHLDKNGFE